ncbi:MAG: hypothetical protein HZC49_00800 [Nitrospirae bacterium]|nr:hypothetical protein [Nitrospirota bacterium]
MARAKIKRHVIPAKAGIYFFLCLLLLTSITSCGRRGDPVFVPSYEEKIIKEESDKQKELTRDEAVSKEETEIAVPDAPSEVTAVYTGKSVVLVWKEVLLKQGVTSYRVYRSTGEDYVIAGETVSPAFTDRDIEKQKKYHYKITALGRSESLPSEEITIETEGE